MLAQRIAASADMVFECMQFARDGTLDRYLPADPDRASVERLYGDHQVSLGAENLKRPMTIKQ